MIDKKAIAQFLNRQLNNYDWMKNETVEAIDAALAELEPKPNLGKLWVHQRVCFLIIEALKRFMLHIDMGGGKTLITLSLLSYRKQRGDMPKAVIFVPYLTSVETWVEESAKHAPELVCVPLVGTTADNLSKLCDPSLPGDLYVIAYPSAVAMLAESQTGRSRAKTHRIGKLCIRSDTVRSVFSKFDTLVMDEIHKCKSVSSLTYKLCRAISAQCEYVIGLTGTPFGRDLTDLWPQFYLIDFGETLGPTLGFYRAAFFNQTQNYWGGYEYKFQKKLFGTLQRLIKNSSIRYAIDELHDLPEKEYMLRSIKPHDGITAYATKSLETINTILSRKENRTYRAIESEYLKLRQLSSGFMTLHGEDDDKVQVAFDQNPKLDMVADIVEQLPTGSKIVIFHHFVYSNVLISNRLTAMRIKHARIYSKTKDQIAELRKFKEDSDCIALVINSKSGSSSLNLQIANYAIFFEQPDSPIDRQQAERRIWRPGQLKRAFFYDLIMPGTVDAQMHKWNQDGESLLTALLDGRAKL